MAVLLSGNESIISEYETWISDDLTVKTKTCSDIKNLPTLIQISSVDLLVLDYRLKMFDFFQVISEIKNLKPDLPIIVISDTDTAEEAVHAFRMGVLDYLVSPVERKLLIEKIWNFFKKAAKEENFVPQSSRKVDTRSMDDVLPDSILFGESPKTNALKQVLEKIKDTDLPTLITGESGTGKEMIARYIWHHSQRRGPFIRVNCAAIPSELLESELFGFEKGSFTGAHRRKAGKFEAANGGYIFLDEISELSYPLQSKLLHVLQDGTFSTLGSTKEVSVDVRVITATNHNLEDLVQNGRFRDDLYFRLNVVHLHVPPLRERLDQLGALVDYFREQFAKQYNKPAVNFSMESQSLLYSYSWPGNIRELENVVRRATVLGSDDFVYGEETEHLWSKLEKTESEPGQSKTPNRGQVKNAPEVNRLKKERSLNLKEIGKSAALEAEKIAIERVLNQTRWNRKKTAEILDVSYKTLLTKIKETGLDDG